MGLDMAMLKVKETATESTAAYAVKILSDNGYYPAPAIIRPTQISELISSQSKLMSQFLMFGAISAIVLGSINIASTLLLTTRERSREIGIRLSVGAKSSDIAALFLFEIFVATFVGSIIGVIFGFSISLTVQYFMELPIVLSFQAAMMSIVATVSSGVLFGLYPAINASRLNPIEAINYVN